MIDIYDFFPTMSLLLVASLIISAYFFKDNRRLRAIIATISMEKDSLAADLSEARREIAELGQQLTLAITHQRATLEILQRVLESEVQHVRDDERVRIFAAALKDIKVVEKAVTVNVANVGHDQNKVDIGAGAEVGQAASGRGNDQKQV
jgi:arginine deiminase